MLRRVWNHFARGPALLLVVGASALGAAPLAVIPVSVVRDRIMVPVNLNGSNGFSFLLDTGFTMTMVHPELAEALQLRRSGEVTINGIAGEEKATTFEGVVLRLGAADYRPRRVAALASDGNRRRRRDGILGSGLFRQFVVEIDSARKQLALHSPTNFNYGGPGKTVPLRFRRGNSSPIVEAEVAGTNGAVVRGEFEIDTGCDSGLCLGHDFVAANRLLEGGQTRAGQKVGVGGGTGTRSGHLPQLRIGEAVVAQPQADFFLEGSPVDTGLAGHIGMGVLKHFKVILDYSRRQMILEPNPAN